MKEEIIKLLDEAWERELDLILRFACGLLGKEAVMRED